MRPPAAPREADRAADRVAGAASRLDADRFARRLLLPLIDVGINIDAHGDTLNRVGGRMCILWPTGLCLLCMGVLTPDSVAAEADPLGYRGDDRRVEAAVASFNSVLASLAVTEVHRDAPWRSRRHGCGSSPATGQSSAVSSPSKTDAEEPS